ncbi:MAG: hypothetical protein H0Z29_05665 [Candidatus Marinimicrobia bacterium]|nr:hypothetical protein [Candidatus Neomarinimicrobiota bacterium]
MKKYICKYYFTITSNRFLFCRRNRCHCSSQDCSGNYTSIQEALNEAPSNTDDYYVILIKNGIYEEKIFIERSKIILIGEGREGTIITQSIARAYWKQEHNSDWGAATINIKKQRVSTLVNSFQNSGSYKYIFNAYKKNLNSGIYLVSINTEMGTKSIKIPFIK